MAIDPVPWLIGGGAEHSPEVARLLAFAATGGAEGIVTPGDLKVTPLGTPGAGVQVAAGAALIRARSAGGASQTYVGRVISTETVTIAATSSGAARSDLIVLQVEDPFMAGEPWQVPADPAVGPYLSVRVISGVPATTTRLQDVAAYAGRSAITLARVDLPASTGTVDAAKIVDLRALAMPRSSNVLRSAQPPVAVLPKHASTMYRWPGFEPSILIPTWATHVSMSATLSGFCVGGNVQGVLRTAFANVIGGNFTMDITGSAGRETLVLTASGAIDPTLRGRTQTAVVEGRVNTSSPAQIGSNAGSQVLYDVRFEERAL